MMRHGVALQLFGRAQTQMPGGMVATIVRLILSPATEHHSTLQSCFMVPAVRNPDAFAVQSVPR